MFNSANQSGFGSVVLLLMIFVLTVAIGYSVSQVNKPTFKKSFAFEGQENMTDSVNWGSVFEVALDGIQDVINNQSADADRVINNPNSTAEQKAQATLAKGKADENQQILNTTFGEVKLNSKGEPDYRERNQKIKEEWNNALEKNKEAKLPVGFVPDVTNPPIVPRGTSDLERYNANSQRAANAASNAIKP